MSEPFQINVPEEVLTDLRERLGRSRWPDHLSAYGWEQGTHPEYRRGRSPFR